MPLLLASSSPSRAANLAAAGFVFQQHSPNIDETPHLGESALALVKRLSLEKAAACQPLYPEHSIIAGDQVAIFHGDILGKPHTDERLHDWLTQFSGQSLTFYSGLCVQHPNQAPLYDCIETTLSFRLLTEEMIQAYLAHANALKCAAGIKIEGWGIRLLTGVSSHDPSAIIGLPMIRLIDFLGTQAS